MVLQEVKRYFSGGIWDIVFSSYYKSWKTSNANLMNSFDYATTIKEQAVKDILMIM